MLVCLGVTLTACKKDQYIATNTKRVKHQHELKGKYNEPTAKLAKSSKQKGDLD